MVSAEPEYNGHRVPKRDLVPSLDAVIQRDCLETGPACPLQDDLNSEQAAFDFSICKSEQESFRASSGHNDLICTLMLAVWWAERPRQGKAPM